jgi:hypothetical protein
MARARRRAKGLWDTLPLKVGEEVQQLESPRAGCYGFRLPGLVDPEQPVTV